MYGLAQAARVALEGAGQRMDPPELDWAPTVPHWNWLVLGALQSQLPPAPLIAPPASTIPPPTRRGQLPSSSG